MILTIFGILTAVEAVILSLKINQILEYRDYAKQVGMHLPFHDKLDKIDKFLIRLYNNYNDLLWVFIVVILFLNLILSVVICAIIYAAILLITL